jgi:hypothetical protein
MTKRLIIDTSRVCISKPGIDVSTSSFNDNLFDSRYYKYIAAYARGILFPSNFQTVGTSAIGPFGNAVITQAIVPYGKTFASPPIVLAMFTGGYWSGPTPWFNQTDVYLVPVYDQNGFLVGYRGAGAGVNVGVKSTVDHAIFEIYYYSYTYWPSGPSAIAYYVAHNG